MVDIHTITLYTFVEFFAGVAPFTVMDICLIHGDFLNNNFGVSDHTFQHPVQQGLGITMPAGTSGKGEDFDRHSIFLGAMLKKVGFRSISQRNMINSLYFLETEIPVFALVTFRHPLIHLSGRLGWWNHYLIARLP